MLFRRDPRHRLEPVRKVRAPVLERPILHRARHRVRNRQIEAFAVLDGFLQGAVRFTRQALLHRAVVKDEAAEDFWDI